MFAQFLVLKIKYTNKKLNNKLAFINSFPLFLRIHIRHKRITGFQIGPLFFDLHLRPKWLSTVWNVQLMAGLTARAKCLNFNCAANCQKINLYTSKNQLLIRCSVLEGNMFKNSKRLFLKWRHIIIIDRKTTQTRGRLG